MKIYTKTGDSGATGLFAGPRVAKDDVRIEAFGTVDELNAVLGWVRTESLPESVDLLLQRIQHQLFALGAELATPDPTKHGTALVGEAEISLLEKAIDEYDAKVPPLKQFILPGGCRAASGLHVARSVCRRAERRVVTLFHTPHAEVSQRTIEYLNRLGDLLFVLARFANQHAGYPDIPWKK